MSDARQLSPKQQRALQALLTASTQAEAARLAGVGERSIQRWLSEDEVFRAAYRGARARAMDVTVAALQQAATEAVRTLRDVMGDEAAPAASRVTAARAVLELAPRWAEAVELAERIGALERAQHDRHGAEQRGGAR